MNKQITLSVKIADEAVSVNVIVESTGSQHITLRASNREEALIASYCYFGQMTKIERAADGGFLVVVYKSAVVA